MTSASQADRSLPHNPAKIDVRDLDFFYGSQQALKSVSIAFEDRTDNGSHRSVGLRQVDASARPQPDLRLSRANAPSARC